MRYIGYLLILALVLIWAVSTLAPVPHRSSVAQRGKPGNNQAAQTTNRDNSTVTGKPSISAQFINTVLCTFHSPTCGKGQALYDLGLEYGIDPAYALAFFMNESSFGRAGIARQSLSIGNLRCIPGARCIDNFAWFDTWEQGFRAWYALIKNVYVAKWHLTTVDAILPVYAPAADNNKPLHYISVVKSAVRLWRAGKVALS